MFWRYISTCSVIGLLIYFFSCNQPSYTDNGKLKTIYYPNGKIKIEWVEVNEKKNGYEFSYYENGNLKTVFFYKDDVKVGEQLWFHENGFLSKKIILINDTANGMAYYFYPSGNLKADRFYRNDKVIGIGADYWDRSYGVIKSSLHFNDSGQIFYKKYFDSSGKYVGEEGRRL